MSAGCGLVERWEDPIEQIQPDGHIAVTGGAPRQECRLDGGITTGSNVKDSQGLETLTTPAYIALILVAASLIALAIGDQRDRGEF